MWDVELEVKGDPVPQGLATACRASHWYQGSLTAPDEASDKPGPGTIQGTELGAKQMESGTGLETGILQQHQGRNQQPWDGLKCGPGQPAGTIKLNGSTRCSDSSLVLNVYLIFVLQ